jgi:hypothetical protein
MTLTEKGKSPFYPGQPVPVELFVGRSPQIERILSRGVKQVAAGKSMAFFVQGEYGIGKSSIAGYLLSLAEKDYGLLPLYVSVGGAKTLEELALVILEATLQSGAYDPTKSEVLRHWLAKYIGEQKLFGFASDFKALQQDAPALASPFRLLGFLHEAQKRLKPTGLFVVLDEINGITANADFAHFIEGLVEQNAQARSPLPLLLMLCGVEERRKEMIERHPPIDRIFDIVDIQLMSAAEMREFFGQAFALVETTVKPDAMDMLVHYSAGFPKIMHTVGDAAFWIDKDNCVDKADAFTAILNAADDVGKKYVDQQVYKALRSEDYRSILARLAKVGPPDVMTFTKAQIAADLTATETKKLNNFLQKMKKLNVIQPGESRGEYVFWVRMVRLYIWLQSVQKM